MARVLLIDDDDMLRAVVRRALERAGHTVVEAADGAAGLRLHREAGADVIIADIFMPEQDGLELIQALRAEAPRARIIAMSGGGRSGQVDLLKDATVFGAARTLRKPFELTELVATVGALAEPPPS